MELGTLVAHYGPFRIHEWLSQRLDESRGIGGNYAIVTSSDVTGEFIITYTRGLTSNRDDMLTSLHGWLNAERYRLRIGQQDIDRKRTPEGMRDLQEAMDADRRASGDWSTPPYSAADHIADAEQALALLQRRYDLVEQQLREYEHGDLTADA